MGRLRHHGSVHRLLLDWPYHKHLSSRNTHRLPQRGLRHSQLVTFCLRRRRVTMLCSVWDSQFIPVWNCWPQPWQESSPMPAFLSNLTDTDFSWLQKRHGKLVERGSFYTRSMSRITKDCTKVTGLQHQPFSTLAVSERTSCVYPKVDQTWSYFVIHFGGSKLTMGSFE